MWKNQIVQKYIFDVEVDVFDLKPRVSNSPIRAPKQPKPFISAPLQWTTQHPLEGIFTLGDARSFSRLTSKIPPLASMLNFDADVKETTARHPNDVKTASFHRDVRPTHPV